ncbi:hypothetical protein CPB83DRAFT_944500 [Crepidotus variabilis]|uniref:Uncharacterized protein n=1 Tax=Crepidotus variabilis TaxID=179855 RepID=A0A9P6E9P4_9AGAR|nr:hypothetical protein CPB83DRAFT_944500 [Crepidotus variabilis]
MGVSHTFHFNAEKYRLKYNDLVSERIHQKYRMKRRSGYAHIAACTYAGYLLVPTCGLSALSWAYSARQASVIDQMHAIMQEELKKRGEPPCVDRDRDAAIGCGIGILGVLCACGIEHFVDIFPDTAADLANNLDSVGGPPTGVADAFQQGLSAQAAHVVDPSLALHPIVVDSGGEFAGGLVGAGTATAATHAAPSAMKYAVDAAVTAVDNRTTNEPINVLSPEISNEKEGTTSKDVNPPSYEISEKEGAV